MEIKVATGKKNITSYEIDYWYSRKGHLLFCLYTIAAGQGENPVWWLERLVVTTQRFCDIRVSLTGGQVQCCEWYTVMSRSGIRASNTAFHLSVVVGLDKNGNMGLG